MKPSNDVPAGYREVFCRSVKLKNGKRIFPKNGKVFRFIVKDK